jgi:hypothetical protein
VSSKFPRSQFPKFSFTTLLGYYERPDLSPKALGRSDSQGAPLTHAQRLEIRPMDGRGRGWPLSAFHPVRSPGASAHWRAARDVAKAEFPTGR